MVPASIQTRYEIQELVQPVRLWLANAAMGLSFVLMGVSLLVAYVVNDFASEPIKACVVTYGSLVFCDKDLTVAKQERAREISSEWVSRGRPDRFVFKGREMRGRK